MPLHFQTLHAHPPQSQGLIPSPGSSVLVWCVPMCFFLGLIPTCQRRLGEAAPPVCACSPHAPGAWQDSQLLPRWSRS